MTRYLDRPTYDRPLAAAPFHSYRAIGRYGWIMIGANDDDDALKHANFSSETPLTKTELQKWCNEREDYFPVK